MAGNKINLEEQIAYVEDDMSQYYDDYGIESLHYQNCKAILDSLHKLRELEQLVEDERRS